MGDGQINLYTYLNVFLKAKLMRIIEQGIDIHNILWLFGLIVVFNHYWHVLLT